MRIAVCDDDALYRGEVCALIKEFQDRHTELNITVSAFSRGTSVLDTARTTGGFDIYILDIIMPEINGIDLGIALREAGFNGLIIYLTSSEEYAIDSFKAQPFNYILKPIDHNAFLAAFSQAIHSIRAKQDKSLIVRTQENSVRLSFDSILYAELSRRAIVYHLRSGSTVTSVQIRTTFAEAVQTLLKDRRFVLCGASMTVNLDHITVIGNDALVFKDTHKAYLGKKACRELRSVWYDYCFDGEDSK